MNCDQLPGAALQEDYTPSIVVGAESFISAGPEWYLDAFSPP